MIAYEHVSITLGGRRILDDVSFRVPRGSVFCIVGRSGAGKSVTIKQLVGLLRPDSGRIWFDGIDVTALTEPQWAPVRKRCQMVFQHATLFDSMSCLDNVMLPIVKHRKVPRHRAVEQALAAMAQVGVDHLAHRDPVTLGPGLRKLVAVARALTLEPDAILYDEPTTGLDPLAARKFDRLVSDVLAPAGITQVVVSHDVRSVFDVAHKVAMLHEGGLHFLGTPRELESCDDPVVWSFVRGIPQTR